MSNPVRNPVRVEGQVAPGFEPVKARFEHNMKTLAERNAQLCILSLIHI